MNKIDKVSSRLFSEGTKDPSFEEIATAIDTMPGEIEKIKHSFKDTQPIDELTENNQDMLLNSPGNVHVTSPFEQTLYLDLQLKLDQLLSMLSKREREVVRLRFGVGKKRDHTLDEIGIKMGLSRERIRQILEKVLTEMKTPEFMKVLKDYIEVN
jgi:RNA polymerase sigma factor (sigma-70 family)